MPGIVINELNNTTFLNRSIENDNIVLVIDSPEELPNGEQSQVCYSLREFYELTKSEKVVDGTTTVTYAKDAKTSGVRTYNGYTPLKWEYAANMIRSGFPVLFIATNSASTWTEKLKDKLLYDVKFIPTIEDCSGDAGALTAYQQLVEDRKDCILLVDFYGSGCNISTDNASYVAKVAASKINNCSYAVVPYPGGSYISNITGESINLMPPSFFMLRTMAEGVNAGTPLYSIWAGSRRGVITGLKEFEHKVPTLRMEDWTKNCDIIPLLNIPSYGNLIYGNNTRSRTYNDKDGKSTTATKDALNSLNVRLTANEIKRAIYKICLGLTFESNDFVLWNTFRMKLSAVLDAMKEARAINDYIILMDETVVKTDDIEQLTVPGIVKVDIARAAEHFDINFELTPVGANLSESV